jgi:hypothetical protein
MISQLQLMNQWSYEYEIWYDNKLQTYLQIIKEILFVRQQIQTLWWCEKLQGYIWQI